MFLLFSGGWGGVGRRRADAVMRVTQIVACVPLGTRLQMLNKDSSGKSAWPGNELGPSPVWMDKNRGLCWRCCLIIHGCVRMCSEHPALSPPPYRSICLSCDGQQQHMKRPSSMPLVWLCRSPEVFQLSHPPPNPLPVRFSLSLGWSGGGGKWGLGSRNLLFVFSSWKWAHVARPRQTRETDITAREFVIQNNGLFGFGFVCLHVCCYSVCLHVCVCAWGYHKL